MDPGGEDGTPPSAHRIQRLDEVVINRIAAGEVIHRPVSALKEMLENSLDAGATSLTIIVKQGGLKLLQVQDNGRGIHKADLPIVCARFTTSKLRTFDDLQSINTFGFRGEALASISHVAHVTITSKTDEETCAYRACYSGGKLVPAKSGESPDPKPLAGVRGTLITVEDLFYNVVTRQKALRSSSEEYSRIVEVVQRYAIHRTGVGFSCKKHGESHTDVHTLSSASCLDTIRSIYGASVARELLPLEYTGQGHEFRVSGFVSNANYSMKKGTHIFFINDRLVDCPCLKRTIDTLFTTYLPKGTRPWVYIGLFIPPGNVDVNVHPTKREVHFLHEDDIIEEIQKAIEQKLTNANASRTFYTQVSLPDVTPVMIPSVPNELESRKEKEKEKEKDMEIETEGRREKEKSALPLPYKFVRTDVRQEAGAIERFVRRPIYNDSPRNAGISSSPLPLPLPPPPPVAKRSPRTSSEVPSPIPSRKEARLSTPGMLTSVKRLLGEIEEAKHEELTDVFRRHTFVGYVDDEFALIQHTTRLYLVNYCTVSNDFLYQRVLGRFATFRKIQLAPAAPIYDLVMLALDLEEAGWTEEDGEKSVIAKYISDLWKEKGTMLDEYFALQVDEEGHLKTLPLLVEGHLPDLVNLPMFCLRMGTEVDWAQEQTCFDGIARELALFFRFRPLPSFVTGEKTLMRTQSQESAESGAAASTQQSSSPREDGNDDTAQPRPYTVQHVLFPALRSSFAPSRRLAASGSVVQVARLENLYKIFERC